ncbi:unnamed protein product [Rotaria magnacalcarata]|uniref:Uncharacterized protein n=1 Tax=Rotaria magnacalcarata TaxID=392030 RepID=A0A814FLS5_9BILA|nr:unnamed protein product [Rotaria magnacalcarata]CAF4385282.1 unnamed protein product [Rotaria magnacalcarata]CAF4693140.1 unnamed protein product [Rotaria magnacalcarata]CAF4888717.1 unnamed protein product [Rotaria magnacalcarata]
MNCALPYTENAYSSNMSHEVAWSTALLFKNDDTLIEQHLNLIEKTTHSFVGQPIEQGTFPESINSPYDQSAETIFWLLEIVHIFNEH